jgi:superfamily II DNA or RNA helicase
MAFELRDYQQKGKDKISERFRMGDKKVMLWAQTGAGKGLWMADFVRESVAKGMPVGSVMRRREIIFQTIKNYEKYFSIGSNAIMGTLKGQGNNLSTVASIDTLRNRIRNTKYHYLQDIPFWIVDECHDLTSATYERLIWFLEGFALDEYNNENFNNQKEYFKKNYVGLTATPFRVGKRTHTFWDSVVKPIEAHELRDRGFLVPAKIFAPKKIDTSGLRVNPMTGDFDQKEVFERVSKMQVVGDVIETYKIMSNKHFGQLKPAIMFCVNQQHSKIMAEAFRRAGIPAIHCDADHTKEERDAAIAGLKSGKYKVLTNCNIFSTGFDAPWIEIEIGGRPSDSENLTLQQWGRVLRPYKICANCSTEYGGDPSCWRCGSTITSYEKKFALILDHANNTSRWGLPYDVREPELELIDTARKNSYLGLGVKTCPKCFGVLHSNERFCVCGHDFVQATQFNGKEAINHVGGELHEVNEEFLKERTYQEIKQKYNTYKRLEMLRGWGPNAKFFKLHQDFGEKLFEYSAEFGISRGLKKKMQEGELEKGIQGFLDNVRLDNAKVIT